jgi:hypothetical protein
MDVITLHFEYKHNRLFVKMRQNARLEIAMRAWCERHNAKMDSAMFSSKSRILMPNDTPFSLGLVNHEEIVVEIF